MYPYNGLPFTNRGVWSCPRLTTLLDQGAPRAKLVETIGHMVAASQASWHQRSGQNQTFQNHGQYTKWLIGFACSIWYAVDPWIVFIVFTCTISFLDLCTYNICVCAWTPGICLLCQLFHWSYFLFCYLFLDHHGEYTVGQRQLKLSNERWLKSWTLGWTVVFLLSFFAIGKFGRSHQFTCSLVYPWLSIRIHGWDHSTLLPFELSTSQHTSMYCSD